MLNEVELGAFVVFDGGRFDGVPAEEKISKLEKNESLISREHWLNERLKLAFPVWAFLEYKRLKNV